MFLVTCSQKLELVTVFCTRTVNICLWITSLHRLKIKIDLAYHVVVLDFPNKVSPNKSVYISVTAQYLLLFSDKHTRPQIGVIGNCVKKQYRQSKCICPQRSDFSIKINENKSFVAVP